jgi:hypothetical protein
VSLLLSMLAVGSAICSTIMDEAEKLSWNTQNIGALKALFSNAASVETFIKDVNPKFAVNPVYGESVGQYEFIDLGNNGEVELLATVDFTGRKIYDNVYIVQKVNNDFRISDLMAGENIFDLKSHIVDLNNDGRKEFLLPRRLAQPKFMVDPRPAINDVYAWDGTGFRKANASFKNYYRSLLPGLKAEHEAIVQGKKKLVDPSQKALLEKKYEREIEEVNKILNE